MRIFCFVVTFLFLYVGNAFSAPTAILLEVKGPIGPAVSHYISQGFKQAKKSDARLIILKIDTPGGLDTSMREIIQTILQSPIPVASYVTPSGARAASAGLYILYASHISAMAPGTNLGAATPVQIGQNTPIPTGDEGAKQEQPQTKYPGTSEKVIKDAVAYIKGLAQLHGRNAEWAERAITEAASLPANEALSEGVIDVIADSTQDLLLQIDGRTINLNNQSQVLNTSGMTTTTIEPNWYNKLLSLITNPNIAYILLILGIYGLIFEFMNPGSFIPGVFGIISLLLGLYALHLLPINFVGLALLLLGIGFMITEAFSPSFGIFGLGGIVAFTIGSIMLLDTDIPGFEISWPIILTFAGGSALFSVFVLGMAVQARRRPVVTGTQEMVGAVGEVISWGHHQGIVRIHGETWHAESDTMLQRGEDVKVIKLDGLIVTVEPTGFRGD